MRIAIRSTRAKAVFAAALVLTAPEALAWGPQGHRTIGAIADRLLTPAARTAVQHILQNDLDKFDNPSGRTTLEEVSEWADEVRGTPAARPAWHYDDVPICGTRDKASYCPGGQCNTEQLKRLTGVVADARAPARERDEALKWVVHLVGDIHQPLHAADNGDHGGNLVPVALEGVHTRGRENLHRAWDNDLVQQVGQGTPDSWARESNNLARNVAYHYPGFACNSVPSEILVLDGTYLEDAVLVVRERLLLAGARLAAVLNAALAPTEFARLR